MDFYSACRASPELSGVLGATTAMPHVKLTNGHDSQTSQTRQIKQINQTNQINQHSHDSLREQHRVLREQHERLKMHFDCLSETVKVLGDQSSQTTRVAQLAQDSKLDLAQRHSSL